ncbi:hypothetical protein [Pedobacter westerhofensis]|nr:hypothetical protein [Pedobacter westerhofensis]
MKTLKLIKILFLIAGLMLSIKPLVGFGLIHNANTNDGEVNIWLLQKLFSKRKQDYLEDDLAQVIAIQQRLSDGGFDLISKFCYLLIERLFAPISSLHLFSNSFLTQLSLRVLPERDIYLPLGKLTI